MKYLKKKLSGLLVMLTLSAILLAACGAPTQATTSTTAVTAASAAETATQTTVATETTSQEATSTSKVEASTTTVAAAAGAITVKDMTGREVQLDEAVTRIVALTPSDCEILYAIGAGDALVGRGEYCNQPAEVLEVQSVQSGQDTNIEQIIALKPQVLLMSTMAQTEEHVAQLEAAGVKVLVSDAKDIAGVYQSIFMIGQLMGKDEAAKGVVEGMKETFAKAQAEVKGDGSKSIYFEVSPLEYGLWTTGKGTFMQEAADMLGLKNIFDDVEGWAEISEEQVIERNPDYILTISMYFGEGPTPIEEIKARPGWQELNAVKNDAILNLQNDELSRPGPRLAEGVDLLGKFVEEKSAE